jgi:hypothetical protein
MPYNWVWPKNQKARPLNDYSENTENISTPGYSIDHNTLFHFSLQKFIKTEIGIEIVINLPTSNSRMSAWMPNI